MHPDGPGAELRQPRDRTWHPNSVTSDLHCGSEWWICCSRVGSQCGRPVVVPILPENDRKAG